MTNPPINDPQTYLQQAQDYCIEGKFSQAIKVCEQTIEQLKQLVTKENQSLAVETSPAPAITTNDYLQKGDDLRSQGQIEEAIACYIQAIETQPDWAEIQANLGSLYAQQQQWESAINCYQQALVINPQLVGAYRNLARVYNQTGQMEQSVGYWYQALKLEPDWAKPTEHISLGNQLEKQGKLAQAKECYIRALALQSDLITGYEGLGRIYQTQDQLKELINCYQQGVAHNPKNTQLHYYLGQAWAQIQQWNRASDCYRKAIKLGLETASIYFSWAEVLKQQQKWQPAAKQYRQAISLQPDFWQAYHQLGNVLVQLEKFPPAIKAYQQAIELEPEIAWSHHNLGVALGKQGRLGKAIASYRRAIELSPEVEPFHRSLGEALQQNGQLQLAINSFKTALELKPDTAEIYLQLASIYRQKSNIPQAVDTYLQAIKLQPDWQKPYVQLRCNLLRYEITNQSPLVEQVIEICRQVIQKQPKQVSAYNTLGYALTKQGKLSEAIGNYQQASYLQAQKKAPKISKSEWDNATRNPPKFMVIGAEKSGTTSLYHYLNQHPQFLPSIEKELDFFDIEYNRGIDWYLAHFPPLPEQYKFITGEVSANYIYSPQAPQRVWDLFPELKLIVILRNPVARTISRYHMLLNQGSPKQPLEQAINQEINNISAAIESGEIPWQVLNRNRNVGNSLYIYHLKRWLKVFPREQLLVLKSEEFYQNPATTLEKIFAYLEVPNHQLPNYQKYNAGSYGAISEEITNKLADFFAPHNQQLADYLEIDFNWGN